MSRATFPASHTSAESPASFPSRWLFAGWCAALALAVLVALAPVLLEGIVPRAEGKEDKVERAVTALEAVGGRVLQSKRAAAPFGEALEKEVGDRYSVNLTDSAVKDGDLAYLEDLPGIWRLDLHGTRVGDQGLKHVAKVRGLEELDLSQTPVSDAGLSCIGGLHGIKALILWETGVGDRGLEHLRGLTKLHELSLEKTKVSDAGLRVLEGFPKPRQLYLSGT